MPLFEYRCRKCSRRFEALVIGTARPACPGCGGADLEKLISTFAVASGTPRSFRAMESPAEAGACGTCGDPRGPGSCSTN